MRRRPLLEAAEPIALIALLMAAVILFDVIAAIAAPSSGGEQLLRTTERARISAVAADHEPFALGQSVRLAVEVEMLPGMHVNANPPTHDWLIPIEVSIAGADGVRLIEAFYPEAKSVKFPYDDEPYLVYDGTFVLGLTLGVADAIPAGGRELEVVVDYQACNDEACFAPTKTSVKLPIMLVANPAESRRQSSTLIDRAPFPER